jgi:hypothetical protein
VLAEKKLVPVTRIGHPMNESLSTYLLRYLAHLETEPAFRLFGTAEMQQLKNAKIEKRNNLNCAGTTRLRPFPLGVGHAPTAHKNKTK